MAQSSSPSTKMLSASLLESSLHAALASIEIYNKPDFKYREQTFTVLTVNAWELLLKAKILRDNSESLQAIYALKSDGTHKTNRSGNPMTIEITGAIKQCNLDSNIVNNLGHLIEIRDTAAHFYHDSALAYIVYTLGCEQRSNNRPVNAE